MLRLLVIAGLIYLLYRAFNSWLLKHGPSSGGAVADRRSSAVDDVMIKDPQCHVYFPKRDAVRVTTGDQELFFCSTDCRDKYLLENRPD
jgi:hypothetical protein